MKKKKVFYGDLTGKLLNYNFFFIFISLFFFLTKSTVFQNLWYAAQFKLSSDMPREEKLKRVNELILKMGLESCKDR